MNIKTQRDRQSKRDIPRQSRRQIDKGRHRDRQNKTDKQTKADTETDGPRLRLINDFQQFLSRKRDSTFGVQMKREVTSNQSRSGRRWSSKISSLRSKRSKALSEVGLGSASLSTGGRKVYNVAGSVQCSGMLRKLVNLSITHHQDNIVRIF